MTVGRREDSGRNPDVLGLIFGLPHDLKLLSGCFALRRTA